MRNLLYSIAFLLLPVAKAEASIEPALAAQDGAQSSRSTAFLEHFRMSRQLRHSSNVQLVRQTSKTKGTKTKAPKAPKISNKGPKAKGIKTSASKNSAETKAPGVATQTSTKAPQSSMPTMMMMMKSSTTSSNSNNSPRGAMMNSRQSSDNVSLIYRGGIPTGAMKMMMNGGNGNGDGMNGGNGNGNGMNGGNGNGMNGGNGNGSGNGMNGGNGNGMNGGATSAGGGSLFFP
jgi:hypothetical protein